MDRNSAGVASGGGSTGPVEAGAGAAAAEAAAADFAGGGGGGGTPTGWAFSPAAITCARWAELSLSDDLDARTEHCTCKGKVSSSYFSAFNRFTTTLSSPSLFSLNVTSNFQYPPSFGSGNGICNFPIRALLKAFSSSPW